MKILNLYAGIGGNRKLWGDDHEVVAVEWVEDIANIYKDFFPHDRVLVADAHKYLLDHYKEFDFIWSSPPCPTHSRVRYGLGVCGGKTKAIYPDMTLYQEIIFLKHHFKGKWCVENVQPYYKPLITPFLLGRHCYWTNFLLSKIKVEPSRISQQSKAYSKSPTRVFKASDFEKKYGFDLSNYKGIDKRLLLRNCVEPELGKHILYCATNESQLSLL